MEATRTIVSIEEYLRQKEQEIERASASRYINCYRPTQSHCLEMIEFEQPEVNVKSYKASKLYGAILVLLLLLVTIATIFM